MAQQNRQKDKEILENKKELGLLYVIDGLEFGGGERVFLQLAEGFKDNYRIYVAAEAGGSFEKKIKNMHIRFLPVEMKKQLSLKPILQIKGIIQKYHINILHSQGARVDFYSRIAGKIAGVPYIVSTIAMPVEGFDVGNLKKKIYRFADYLTERFVDRFIVVSESLKHMLTGKRGIPAHRVARIYNGIELDRYRPSRSRNAIKKSWGIYEDAPVIGSFGRLVWQKGFKYLLRAIPQIIMKIENAKFLIAGDGKLRADLEKLAAELKITDNVIFTGYRTDINFLLDCIDILVVPSVKEGLPMIILEAMAMAKPIVASRIPGIIEQISDKKEGLLITARSPVEIASAVLNLTENKTFAIKLGNAARKKAEALFSVEKMLAETKQVYVSLYS